MKQALAYPTLDSDQLVETRLALHATSKIPGGWLKVCRTKRKHWWHASLRPSLQGLTTGVIHAQIDFEMSLNLRESELDVRTAEGAQYGQSLDGASSASLSAGVRAFLLDQGVNEKMAPEVDDDDSAFNYSPEVADDMGVALSKVTAAMVELRAGIREETSPIQLWPHHFDLSMLWLPGDKVDGQVPADEEYADKQMNFGFSFGDDDHPSPYFYITAYPVPDGMADVELPPGAQWQTGGFTGVNLSYDTLIKQSDPNAYLLGVWVRVLTSGRRLMRL